MASKRRTTRRSSTSRGDQRQRKFDAWSRRPGGTDWNDGKVASVARGVAVALGGAAHVEGDRVAALMSGEGRTNRGSELYEALGEQAADMLLDAIQAGIVDPEALLASIAASAEGAANRSGLTLDGVGGLLGAAVSALKRFGPGLAYGGATAAVAYGAGRSIVRSGQGGRSTNLLGPSVGAAAGGFLGSRVGMTALGASAGGWLGNLVQQGLENVVPGGEGPGRSTTVNDPNLSQGEDMDLDGVPDVQDPFPEDSAR